MEGSKIPPSKTDKEKLEERVSKIDNKYANIIWIISTIIIIIGVIIFFVQISSFLEEFDIDTQSKISFFDIIASASLFGGLGLTGFILAEIIQILHDIRYNLYSKK